MVTKDKLISREDVSSRLVEFRETVLHTSQTKMADQLGVSMHTLQSYEQGRVEISADFLVKLSVRLGVDPRWVLLGEGKNPIPIEQRDSSPAVQRAARLVHEVIQEKNASLPPLKSSAIIQAVYQKLAGNDGEISRQDIELLVELAS